MPASSDLEAQSGDDESPDHASSRDESGLDEVWTLEDERRDIWGVRRMCLGVIGVFLVSLYFAWDGTNESAALRAALFAVPAAGFFITLIVYELKHHRRYRELLDTQRDVTRQVAEDLAS